jgi:hypothetical protein
MSNSDRSLKRKESFQKAFFKASGLKPTNEITEALVNDESLSLEQLRKHYTLTEIGAALIRLDAWCIPCDGTCECITVPFLKIKCCRSSQQAPPDDEV